MKKDVSIMWFRRDLRLEDNTALFGALTSGFPVVPVFICDTVILSKLETDDIRIPFLDGLLEKLDSQLRERGSFLRVEPGTPEAAFKILLNEFNIKSVHFNRDYEPYATERDKKIKGLLESSGAKVTDYKDQVIFEKNEVVKDDGKPYTVFTPYSRRWLSLFNKQLTKEIPSERQPGYFTGLAAEKRYSLSNLGFSMPSVHVRDPLLNENHLTGYAKTRDIPSVEGTSFLGPHLRFGTVSIRGVIRSTGSLSAVFLNELIWREFFMQILWHFPHVTEHSFKRNYDRIEWLNNEDHFRAWTEGKTGYPLVDAGMRELSSTGYMHNRVRMVAASFLVKHLLIDWRWGEAWFAQKLLDFELSSNNGNWQWAAGCGCDAAPYFRVFNPELQEKKFDPQLKYIKKWVPEAGTPAYPEPVVEHTVARDRALRHYRKAIAE
jgi:deoxyribodipyrimidine photo-lyase